MEHTTEPIDCIVQPEEPIEYSIADLEKILRVKRRQVLNYSETVCSARDWEPETVFKPRFGRYSERMLAEMRSLQTLGATEYRAQCSAESQKPQQIHSALSSALSPIIANSDLDLKIARLQQSSVNQSFGLRAKLAERLVEISEINQQASDRNSFLTEAEILAAHNQGVEEALAIHSTRIAAKQAALSQLRAMEIGEVK